MRSNPHQHRKASRRELMTAAACGVVVAAMVGLSYAAVPLYDWFCRVTGLNGTTQVASSAPAAVSAQTITVRFDANIRGGLPWKFVPEQTAMRVRLGEVVTVNYSATNLSARETVGVAGYNVAPLNFGGYFQKINCFCFTDQTLKAGETREMAVVFYVDPALARDPDASKGETLTLSYTFYPQRESQPLIQTTSGKPRNGS